MADENPTLRESIEKASEEQAPPPDEAQINSTEEEKEKPKSEKEKVSEGFSDPEINEAINFYNALKDPAQQREIITSLALRAGLIKSDQVTITKPEEKKAIQVLEEILGAEYPDLRDKLGKVFSKFEQENDEKLNSLRYELAQERAAKQVQEFEVEYANFIKVNKVSEDEASQMLKEIQELPPSVGKNGQRIPLTKYLEKIYKLVSSDKKSVSQEVKRVEKIQQNLKERPSHLSSDVSEDRLRKGSKLPSIREAVAAASQGIKFDD